MDDNGIIEYFRTHKLSRTGIRNFLMYKEGARDYVNSQLALHPEYETPGGYITCLVNGIALPKCVICGKVIGYRSFKNGHTHCSMKCFSMDKEVVNKRIKTTFEMYGVVNVGADKNIIAKRNATIRERYGVDAILKNKDALDKMRKTTIERYGVDSWLKTDERKRKSYHQSYQTILGWKDYVIPMFSEEEYHGYKHNEIYRWKCAKCGEEFEAKIGGWGHLEESCKIPRCMKCYPHHTNCSEAENKILEFIKSVYHGEIIRHDRKLLDGMEIDIYLPEIKVAFEYDGLFYHNEDSGKGSDYHLEKTNACLEKGVSLFHIFEDEWCHKRKIVLGRIKEIVGVRENKIALGDCEIRKISNDEYREFANENHLFENEDSSVGYGLFFNGENLLSMAFAKSNDGWKMVGCVNKIGFFIDGGAMRLLNEFEKEHCGTVIFEMDRRFPNDGFYENLGFIRLLDRKPRFWWCQNRRRLNNKQYDDLRKNFDCSKSESDNMRDGGWKRIFDCGTRIFLKKC